MSKEMTIVALGIWVMVVPYLGVPGSWRTVILVLTGVGIAIVGFLLRGEALSRGHARGRATFIEHMAEPAHSETHDHQEGTSTLN